MHEYELSINLDEKTYTYKYMSPIPLGNGVIIENIGGEDDSKPVFVVEAIAIDLTGSVEIKVDFHNQTDKDKRIKWQLHVQENWKLS